MLCGTGWSTRPCTESSSNVDKLSKQEFYDIVNKHQVSVINTWMVAGVAFPGDISQGRGILKHIWYTVGCQQRLDHGVDG